MYQASIRGKKKHMKFHNDKFDNYEINISYEEYAYVKKLLGNCRLLVITNEGKEVIGIIRGSLRKFSNRLVIEVGDIIVISKRDYQDNKVDVVHKYNSMKIQSLILEKKLSNILINYYKNSELLINKENDMHFDNINYESDTITDIDLLKNTNKRINDISILSSDDEDKE